MTEPDDGNPVWGFVKRHKWYFIILSFVGLVLLLAFTVDFSSMFEHFLDWIDDLGFWGSAVLGAALIPWSLFMLPCSVLQLGAGYLFSFGIAIFWSIIGTIIGAIMAFLFARWFCREFVEKSIDEAHDVILAFDEALADPRYGLYVVILIRLSPILPANILNQGFGLTSVSCRDYCLGCVGMIPGIVMMVYLGSLADSLEDLAEGHVEDSETADVFWVVGLVATVVVTFLLCWLTKKVLDDILANRKAGREGPQEHLSKDERLRMRRVLLHRDQRHTTAEPRSRMSFTEEKTIRRSTYGGASGRSMLLSPSPRAFPDEESPLLTRSLPPSNPTTQSPELQLSQGAGGSAPRIGKSPRGGDDEIESS